MTRPATAQVQVLENRTLLTALPAWLSAGSHATWNGATHALTLTGTATILSDPGADEPIVSASGTAERLTIQPGAAAIIHLGGLTLSNGAVADVKSIGGNWAFHDNVIVVLGTYGSTAAPTFAIDSSSGSKLDLEDNDLIIHNGDYASAQALSLIGRAPSGGIGTWTGDGLTSSAAAAVDGSSETRAIGVVANSDLVVPGDHWASGAYSEPLDGNDVLAVYTYVGDFALLGFVGPTSTSIFGLNYDNGASTMFTWATGDTNGDGKLNREDTSIFNLLYGNGLTPDTPVGPFGLAESVTGSTAVTLTWSPAFGAVTNYHVRRSTDGVNFTELTSNAGNGTSFTDTTTVPGTTYMYEVAAENAGQSDPLNWTILPAMRFGDVSGLNATVASSSRINLAWTDNAVDSAAHIEIDRSTDGVNFTPITATLAPTATTYSDTGLAENTQYFYKVEAVSNSSTSVAATANATTPGTVSASVTNVYDSTSDAYGLNLAWSASIAAGNSVQVAHWEVQEVASDYAGTAWWPAGSFSGDTTTANYDPGRGQSASFRVRADLSNGVVTDWAYASGTEGGAYSPAPSVTATAVSSTEVDLSFSSNAATYDNQIDCQVTYAPYDAPSLARQSITTQTLAPGATGTYAVTGLLPGMKYDFMVTADWRIASTGKAGEAITHVAATTTPAIVATAGNGVFAKGQQESVTTITFTGISAADALSRLSASIDWGDGTSSGGSIVQQSAGVFAVTSTHTYANAGVFTGLVTLRDLSSGDTLAMANYSATAVAVTSITATSLGGSNNSITATDTSTPTLYFADASDGSGSISLSAIANPGTPAAYDATKYEVLAADGTLVASGSFSSTASTINLPAPAAGVADAFTIEAGTFVDGNFFVNQTMAAAPARIAPDKNPLTFSLASIPAGQTSGTVSTLIGITDGQPDFTRGTITGGTGSTRGACDAVLEKGIGPEKERLTVTILATAKPNTSYSITIIDNDHNAPPLNLTVNVVP